MSTGSGHATGAFFSETAYRRLPPEIRGLSREAQTVCIFMRMRKTPERIAAETGMAEEQVRHLADEVASVLVRAGKYHLVSDPVFVGLEVRAENGLEPAAEEMDPLDAAALRSFLHSLQNSLQSLPLQKRRVLHLYFQHRMTFAEIADFYGKLGKDMGRTVAEREVTTALKELFDSMEEDAGIPGTLTVSGLKTVLFETGVPE